MATYIAFIATLNLCLGYYLGSRLGDGWPSLPSVSLPKLRRKSKESGVEENSATDVPQEGVATEVEQPAPAEPKPQPPVPEPEQAKEEPEPEVLSEEKSSESGPDTSEILAGLAAFRAKLDTVGNDLRNADQGDREVIDECADELLKANDDYLEIAGETLEKLDDSDGVQADFKSCLSDQTQSIRKTKGNIHEILTQEDSQAVRERLLDSTAELSESAEKAENDILVAVGERQPDETEAATTLEPIDDQPAETEEANELSEVEEPTMESLVPTSTEGLVAIERLEEMIDGYLADETQTAPLQVASLMLDPKDETDGASFDPESSQRLLAGLGEIIERDLAKGQFAALDANGRLLVALLGDDKSLATQRCERTRQQIAGTKFQLDGESIEVTVSCAVADSSSGADRAKVLERLESSLGEANRYGTNRTFHHDGKFPAPVVPQDVEVEPMELEV